MPSADERESIRVSLEQHRDELRLAVQDLGTAARSWTDPTVSIRTRPMAWVVGAFLAGALLGRDR